MDAVSIISGAVLILTSIALIITVMMQEGKTNGVSALTGSDSYYENNNTRTKDKVIFRISKILVIALFVLSFATTIVTALLNK